VFWLNINVNAVSSSQVNVNSRNYKSKQQICLTAKIFSYIKLIEIKLRESDINVFLINLN